MNTRAIWTIKMNTPKRLYRYDQNFRLEIVDVIDADRCKPYSLDDSMQRRLWEYQVAKHDTFKNSMFYGFAHRVDATREAIERLDSQIERLTSRRERLRKLL